MTGLMLRMAASHFKARCLKILDQVAQTGESIVILKRGKPVAEVIPYRGDTASLYPQEQLSGSVVREGDLLSPALPEEAWEALGVPRDDGSR